MNVNKQIKVKKKKGWNKQSNLLYFPIAMLKLIEQISF